MLLLLLFMLYGRHGFSLTLWIWAAQGGRRH